MSSHLLFVYSGQHSYTDHLAALLELARVTRGEVRVHPFVDQGGARYPRLAELRQALESRGLATQIRPSPATWIIGAAQMLICHPPQEHGPTAAQC